MKPALILESIQQHQMPDGSFPYQAGEQGRPDSTAWAVIALSAYARYPETCALGRQYLASLQAKDGHISISGDHARASWPTPLAILAWEDDSSAKRAQELAVKFLLNFSGLHFPNQDTFVMGHDTSIVGWPWIADTHSWVIPTALAITALQVSGLTHHGRISEGVSLLLNRQLPRGGWNSGNTTVFGKELFPLPECTGIALQALAGNTERPRIQRSLNYLLQELPNLRTPISLGWALLGLGAWGFKPDKTNDMVAESLNLQQRHGPYALPSLALLMCAVKAPDGLHSLFSALPLI